HGLELVQGQDGALRLRRAEAGADAQPRSAADDDAERALAASLARFQLQAAGAQLQLGERLRELNRGIAGDVAGAMIEELATEFSGFGGLGRWLTELRVEILENPTQFQAAADDDGGDAGERRYAVN